MERPPWLPMTFAASLLACSSSSFDIADGEAPDAGEEVSTMDAATDAFAEDALPEVAPPDGSSEVADACRSSRPAKAFEASPHMGNICNALNVLDTDGKVTGLDYAVVTTVVGEIDGHTVTGCVGVDFGEVRDLDPLVIVASPSSNACAVTPCVGTACGVGDEFRVFRGNTLGNYTWVVNPLLTGPALTEYPVTLGAPARFVVVCRGAYGPKNDDVAIDSIRTGKSCP